MNNQTLLDTIEPDVAATLVSRREAIRKGASVSSVVAAGLAMGSVPVALAALARDAYGQATGTVTSILQFAYLLENIEAEFYKTVTGGGTGFSATNNPQASLFAALRAGFTSQETATLVQIRKHEEAHVAFLKSQLGASAPTFTGADFDFTGGGGSGTGPFAGAATNKAFLLVTTQAFEDTGVRAYKGQAGNLLATGNLTALEAALRIHSVEARHAAKIRRMRRLANGNSTLRLSGTVRGGGAAAAGASDVGTPPAAVAAALEAIYGGEQSTSHTASTGTFDAATLSGLTGVTDVTSSATEAFDEPLDRNAVVAIVTPFIVNARGLA